MYVYLGLFSLFYLACCILQSKRGEEETPRFSQHFDDVETLCRRRKLWIKQNGADADEKTLYNNHGSFDREVSYIEQGLRKDRESAEEERKHAFEGAKAKLKDALSMTVSGEC